MRNFFIFISLALLLISCGDAGTPGDTENLDGEQCAATWWYLEQDGEIVLEGNKASFTSVPGELYGTPGVTYSQGYFADSDPALGQGCTFLSKTQLAEGIHDNLTCSIATEQGPNPQWIGAESGSDGDHRPVLTSINYEGDYVIGVFEGTMFRLDTLSISPPNIQGNIVNYKFRFNALKEKEFYEPCKNVKAKAICKCGGDTGCAKIEPYYFQTSSNCKDYVTKPIAQKICNGEFVRDYCRVCPAGGYEGVEG